MPSLRKDLATSVVASLREWLSKPVPTQDQEPVVTEAGWEYLDGEPVVIAKPSHVVDAADVQLDSDATKELSALVADVTTAKAAVEGPVFITVLSGKGGVGKTTALLGLSGAAASQGKNVLLIDLDPQGSLSLAATDGVILKTTLEAFKNSTVADVVAPTVWHQFPGYISVAPATRALGERDLPVSPANAHATLVTRLGDLSEFDVVLIDAPATLATLAFEAVAMSHRVIVVAEPTRFSLSSAADAVDFAAAISQKPHGVDRTVKVVLNKADASDEAVFRSDELHQNFSYLVADSTISLSDEINYANGAGVPVQAIPGRAAQAAGREFKALLQEIL